VCLNGSWVCHAQGDYTVRKARSWEALETYLTPEQFQGLFSTVSYSSLINCSTWEVQFCTVHRWIAISVQYRSSPGNW